MPYETFEHTADIGLRIRAKNLNGLFKDAAEGFFNLVTDPEEVQRSGSGSFHEVDINFQEENAAELLMHWLQELLFIFSARRSVLVEYPFISLTPVMLKLKARAVRFDPARHPLRYEVKAVTHHQFRVVQEKGGWLAEVIFDI